MNPEELLAHADFVRGLARSLVLDEHSAADITQQTWLAALEHPPAAGGSVRAWFAKVVRNVAHKFRQGESRRKERERAFALAKGIPTPEEITLREETRRRMIEAVLSLNEPYRSTVLLRFYEDLSPQEVAGRLGVPLETARTRLKRGLEQLRLRLDKAHGGSRRRWGIALAPFAGLKLSSTAAASTGIAALSGVVLMSMKVKAAIAAALIITFTAAVWQILPEYPQDAVKEAPQTEGVAHETGIEEPLKAPDLDDHVAPRQGEEESSRVALPPSGVPFAGQVIRQGADKAVKAFHVRLVRKGGADLPAMEVINETVKDEEGRFSFFLDEGGRHSLIVSSSRFVPKKLENLDVHAEAGLIGVEVVMEHGVLVRGRVVADATGEPVEGALVIPMEGGKRRFSRFAKELEETLSGSPEYASHTYTDADGGFALTGFEGGRTLVAYHPDFAPGCNELKVWKFKKAYQDLEIRLPSGYRIFGRVLDDRGRPCGGVRITSRNHHIFRVEELTSKGARRINVLNVTLPHPSVESGPDGRYCTAPIHPGRVFVAARQAGKPKAVDRRFSEDMRGVEILDRDVELDFGPLPEHVTWRGTFYEGLDDSTPVPSGAITAILTPADPDRFGDSIARKVLCNGKGRFEIPKLVPGKCRLDLTFPGMSRNVRGQVVFIDRPGLLEQDIHLACATVHGVLVDAFSGEALGGKSYMLKVKNTQSKGSRFQLPLPASGSFTLRGLAPGVYTFLVEGPRFSYASVKDVQLYDGQRVEDLRLAMTRNGELTVRFINYKEACEAGLKVRPFRDGEEEKDWPMLMSHDKKNVFQISGPLEPGLWNVRIERTIDEEQKVRCEKTVQILPGKVTKLPVHRSELY